MVGLPTSAWLALGLIALVGLQRLVELRIARRNTERLRAAGAVEHGAGHYPVMVALHASFLASCALEIVVLRPRFDPGLAAVMLAVLVAAAGLRAWVVHTLGDRWTTRVLVPPDRPPIRTGPYAFPALRHPNYLAVALEIAALPLVHGAWRTALVFTCANALLLRHRIRVEERALDGEAPA